MSKNFFPKTLSDWLFLIFVLVLGAECHSYSRHRRAERRRARDMRSVERDYPVIRQEGTLRLIAGNDFLSDDQSEIYDAAIQELARDLRQKSGLRVEIVPPDSIDLQFKPLGQLSTGKVDLFVYSSIYDAAIDNREYRHFAEKRAASLYLVQRHADSTRYISQLSALAGHALTPTQGHSHHLHPEVFRQADRRQPPYPARHASQRRGTGEVGRLREDPLYRLHLP